MRYRYHVITPSGQLLHRTWFRLHAKFSLLIWEMVNSSDCTIVDTKADKIPKAIARGKG